jgi:hypothetical protein
VAQAPDTGKIVIIGVSLVFGQVRTFSTETYARWWRIAPKCFKLMSLTKDVTFKNQSLQQRRTRHFAPVAADQSSCDASKRSTGRKRREAFIVP